ncbi:MAG: hypothetical protein ACOCVY_01720, partial [Patescibacteria group bacterium]
AEYFKPEQIRRQRGDQKQDRPVKAIKAKEKKTKEEEKNKRFHNDIKIQMTKTKCQMKFKAQIE